MLYLKLLLASILFALMFYIGFYRKEYDIFLAQKFGNYTGYHYTEEKFPTDFDKLLSSAVTHHKWLGSTTFTIAFIILSILIIRILFDAHSTLQMVWLYVYTAIVIGLLLILGILTDNYFISYGLAQNIKKLIQSPLLTLFFILYFWKIKPVKERTS